MTPLHRWLGIAICLLGWLGGGGGVAAEGPAALRLAVGQDRASLAGHLDYFPDPGGRLSVDEVADRGIFRPFAADRSLGYRRGAHWFRFSVVRQAEAPADWLLALGKPVLDDIRVYRPRAGGGFDEVRLGDRVPMSSHPIKSRQHALKVPVPAGAPEAFYLRVETISIVWLTADFWRPEAFLADEGLAIFYNAVFFGILAIVAFTHLTFGLWLRDKAIVAYAAHVATLLAQYFGLNGFVGIVVGTELPWLSDLVVGVGTFGTAATSIVMWDATVGLARTNPKLHRFYMAAFGLCLLGLPFVASAHYGTIAPFVINLALAIAYLSMALIARLLWRDGLQVGLAFFFLGLAVAVAGATARILTILGAIPATYLSENAYQVGSLAHVVLLGIGLGYRMRQIQKDKTRAEREAFLATRRAEEQKSFVAMLSHEFRSPLAAIDRAAQMIELKAVGLDDKGRERVDRIRGHAGHLSRLVDNLLASDALDRGALIVRKEAVALAPLVAGLVAGAEDRIAVSLRPAGLTAMVDAELLGLALGNLIQNALEYSPTGSPVTVSLAGEDGNLTVTVADRGPGLGAEDLARLGTPYFRATSSAGIKGIGIGLHLVRKVAAAHGGTLAVHSLPGAGSEFTLRLPA
ncbi:MAG: sensor histidine kinase [Magnetospirillum sp. WYHS-4]